MFQARPLVGEESEEEMSFTLEYGCDKIKHINISIGKTWSKRPEFDHTVSPALMSVLSSTLDSCNQLLELEPESKCTFVY